MLKISSKFNKKLLFLYCLLSLLFCVSYSFAQQEILLNEEYNNNNIGWTEQSKREAKAYVGDGKYICDISSGSLFMDQMIPVNMNTNRDFVIECTMTKKRGDASYGITWGADGVGSRYNFMIYSKGTYSIQKWTNYEVVSFATDTSSYAIRPDFSPNKLSVKKEGSVLMFYINDTYLQEIPFEPFFGPKIGFYANT